MVLNLPRSQLDPLLPLDRTHDVFDGGDRDLQTKVAVGIFHLGEGGGQPRQMWHLG